VAPYVEAPGWPKSSLYSLPSWERTSSSSPPVTAVCREEAKMFLRLGLPENKGWRVRESTCGELTSVLHAPCRDIGHVALDPLPETVGERAVGLVRLSRKHFIQGLLSEVTPPAVEMVGLAS
jgi:hypothetical protein